MASVLLAAQPADPTFAILVLVGVVFVNMFMLIGLAVLFSKFYRKPPPDHAIVRSGHGGLRATMGTGMWVIPALHKADLVSLASVRVDLTDTKLDTEPAKSLPLPNVFQVRVGATRELITRAAQSVISMSPDDVARLAADLILAELDPFLALENNDPSEGSPAERFALQVEEKLNTIGLMLIVCRRQ